jgi:uncharacterized protein YnzC (UPF0291/DUF896 family)
LSRKYEEKQLAKVRAKMYENIETIDDDDEDVDEYKIKKVERGKAGNPVYTRLREN